MERIYKVESIASQIIVPPVMEILASERVRLLRHIFLGGREVHLHYFFNRNLYWFVNDIIYLEKPTEVTDHHSRAMDTKPPDTILMARPLPLTSNTETQLIGGPQIHSHKNDQGTHCPSPGVSGENVKTLIKGTEKFPHRRRNRPFSRVG